MKGIIMKILSDFTVGGRYIKFFVSCLIMMSVISCDIGYTLPLDLGSTKFSYDISFSEDSVVKVESMFFQGFYYLLFDLKGEYVINPDSLKLKFYDKNITVGKSRFCSGSTPYYKNNTHVKNRLIEVDLRYELKDKTQGLNEPLVLFVLPSDFIMRNNKRVLTDSLRFVLKRPKGK